MWLNNHQRVKYRSRTQCQGQGRGQGQGQGHDQLCQRLIRHTELTHLRVKLHHSLTSSFQLIDNFILKVEGQMCAKHFSLFIPS